MHTLFTGIKFGQKLIKNFAVQNNLKKMDLIRDAPFMCRQSHYFQDEAYRDLILKGYTIIYKIENKTIKILDIFKWQDR